MAPRPKPADPLADLRSEDPPGPPTPEVEQEAAEVPLFSAEWHAEGISRAVLAMHDDTVATGSLHKGGTCPCAYLARLVLRAAAGPVREVEPDDEGSDDGR